MQAKQRACLGWILTVFLTAWLLFLIIAAAVYHKWFLLIFTALTFVIGKKASYKTLRFYTAAQIAVILASIAAFACG